jgi:hypothetical protein
MNKTHISTERLVMEMTDLPLSRKLPSYDDLARLSRQNTGRSLKRMIHQLVKKCVEYIDFLHAFSKSGKSCKCGAEIDQDKNFKLFSKKRSSFSESFKKMVEQLKLFDLKRPILWARAINMPDLTAAKIALSALNPHAYHRVMALYRTSPQN